MIAEHGLREVFAEPVVLAAATRVLAARAIDEESPAEADVAWPQPEPASAMIAEAQRFIGEAQVGQRFEIHDGDLRGLAVCGDHARLHLVVFQIERGFALVLQRFAEQPLRRDRDFVTARAVAPDGQLLREIETAGERQ